MSTVTRIAVAVALVLSASSVAFAQPHHAARHHRSAIAPTFQSRDAALPRGPVSSGEESWMDRASQSFSGGGY